MHKCIYSELHLIYLYLDALFYFVLDSRTLFTVFLYISVSRWRCFVAAEWAAQLILNENECHWTQALLSRGCGGQQIWDQLHLASLMFATKVKKKKPDVVLLDRHAQQGSVWLSRRKYSSFIIQPRGMKINHLHRRRESARVTVLTSEPSQVSSFPYSWQAGLFLASDVTGLSWWSLVTVGRSEPGEGGC